MLTEKDYRGIEEGLTSVEIFKDLKKRTEYYNFYIYTGL